MPVSTALKSLGMFFAPTHINDSYLPIQYAACQTPETFQWFTSYQTTCIRCWENKSLLPLWNRLVNSSYLQAKRRDISTLSSKRYILPSLWPLNSKWKISFPKHTLKKCISWNPSSHRPINGTIISQKTSSSAWENKVASKGNLELLAWRLHRSNRIAGKRRKVVAGGPYRDEGNLW